MRFFYICALLTPLLSGCLPSVEKRSTKAEKQDRGDFNLTWGTDRGFEDYSEWSKEVMKGSDDSLNETYKLPVDIDIQHEKCGFENAYWDGERITMCYEMEALVIDVFVNGIDASDEEILDASFYTWVFILFHELGHGLIDVYGLPVPGSEEDAADAFSAVALIDAGESGAVIDAAVFWLLLEDQYGGNLDFADEHSMNMQRFYNLLCWVYGSSPREYGDLVDYFPELKDRVANGRCVDDYQQQSDSWHKLLKPWYQ